MTAPITTWTPITPANTGNNFRNAYALSLHPEVLTLMLSYPLNDPGDPRFDADTWAGLLNAAIATGEPIDEDIHVRGWDSFSTTANRAGYGYTWVPAVGQQAVFGSPYDPITAQTFSGPVPSGAIKVSLSVTDYPPFAAPAPPAIVGPTPPGAWIWGKEFSLGKGAIPAYGTTATFTWTGLLNYVPTTITNGVFKATYLGQAEPVGGSVPPMVWELQTAA